MSRFHSSILCLLTLAPLAGACRGTTGSATRELRQPGGAATTATVRASSPQLTAQAIDAAATARDAAAAHATQYSAGWRALPADTGWRVILDPNRAPAGSFSFGTVADGVLLDAAELAVQGDHHSIIERHRKNKTRWGTQELVGLLREAGAYVYAHEGGAPLRIGNMSKARGGDIPWSRSHNSGRDADLAFYVVVAATGESVPAPDLLRFDDAGIPAGREDLRFDVVRNWRLTEALLRQTDVNVQWLFISLGLKQLLLDHAQQIGADPEIIRRAQQVLHQPTDSRPHADHFHLRVGCSRDDRVDGCLDYGPQWDWLDWHRDALLARSLALADVFEEGNAADRLHALEFLDRIKSPFTADVAGVWGFWDPHDEVRQSALRFANAQHSWSGNALVQVGKFITTGSPRPAELETAYAILRKSRDPFAMGFVVARMHDQSLAADERAYAARALAHQMTPDVVVPLVQTLEDQDAAVREAAAEVLRRVSNRDDGVAWATAPPPERAAAVQQWRTWWQANQTIPREVWLAEGFRRLGVDVDDALGARHIDALVALLTHERSFVRYNANRAIREITGRWAPLEQDDGQALAKYWEPWWKKNRDRVLSGELGSSPDA